MVRTTVSQDNIPYSKKCPHDNGHEISFLCEVKRRYYLPSKVEKVGSPFIHSILFAERKFFHFVAMYSLSKNSITPKQALDDISSQLFSNDSFTLFPPIS